MKIYTLHENNNYIAEAEKRRIPKSQHQISRSFLEGMYGRAFIHNDSSAIVVFDFVEFFGPFDEQIYEQIKIIEEAHIIAPPPDWIKEIKKRFCGKYVEYTRTAFKPLRMIQGKTMNFPESRKNLSIEDDLVLIKPIDEKIVFELMKEEWSKDIVKNTMLNNRDVNRGLGFAAYKGKKIIGGIGCYTLYKNGVEVEIDTHENYRRKGVATELAKQMIIECNSRNLECHWDAMNKESASLAQKLGFEKKNEYRCVMLSNSKKK